MKWGAVFMNDADEKTQDVAQTIAKYLATDEELLRNFRQFDINEVSMDSSPQSFYCGWVMSIMGTAFYARWNSIRHRVAEQMALSTQPDWATISAIAHQIVAEE